MDLQPTAFYPPSWTRRARSRCNRHSVLPRNLGVNSCGKWRCISVVFNRGGRLFHLDGWSYPLPRACSRSLRHYIASIVLPCARSRGFSIPFPSADCYMSRDCFFFSQWYSPFLDLTTSDRFQSITYCEISKSSHYYSTKHLYRTRSFFLADHALPIYILEIISSKCISIR